MLPVSHRSAWTCVAFHDPYPRCRSDNSCPQHKRRQPAERFANEKEWDNLHSGSHKPIAESGENKQGAEDQSNDDPTSAQEPAYPKRHGETSKIVFQRRTRNLKGFKLVKMTPRCIISGRNDFEVTHRFDATVIMCH